LVVGAVVGSKAQARRDPPDGSAHDLEGELGRAPALDEPGKGVPVDDVRERLRDDAMQAETPLSTRNDDRAARAAASAPATI
jgi:hypothetical protein